MPLFTHSPCEVNINGQKRSEKLNRFNNNINACTAEVQIPSNRFAQHLSENLS